MNFKELIKATISCVDFGTREQALTSVKAWFGEKHTLYVTDGENYIRYLEEIYDADKTIAKRFSRDTIYTFVNKRVAEIKLSGEEFKQESKEFFESFHCI